MPAHARPLALRPLALRPLALCPLALCLLALCLLLARPADAAPLPAAPLPAAPLPAAPLPAAPLPAAIAGSWRLTTPVEQIRAQQEAALSAALSSLSVLLHPIADRLIRPTFFYCSTYRITVQDAAFSTSCDGRPPIALSVGGATPVTYDGQSLTAALSGDDREARLSLSGGNGTRLTRYRPGGPGLQVEVSISSAQLASPLRWAMEYRPG